MHEAIRGYLRTSLDPTSSEEERQTLGARVGEMGAEMMETWGEWAGKDKASYYIHVIGCHLGEIVAKAPACLALLSAESLENANRALKDVLR